MVCRAFINQTLKKVSDHPPLRTPYRKKEQLMHRGPEMQSKSVGFRDKRSRPQSSEGTVRNTRWNGFCHSSLWAHSLKQPLYLLFLDPSISLCFLLYPCSPKFFFWDCISLYHLWCLQLKNIFLNFKTVFLFSTGIISSFPSFPHISYLLAWFASVLKYTNNSLKFG